MLETDSNHMVLVNFEITLHLSLFGQIKEAKYFHSFHLFHVLVKIFLKGNIIGKIKKTYLSK